MKIEDEHKCDFAGAVEAADTRDISTSLHYLRGVRMGITRNKSRGYSSEPESDYFVVRRMHDV